MRRAALLLGLLAALAAALAADAPAPQPLTLLVTGLTQDYLEPCGCGGQNAGGLARRAALVAEQRRAQPAALLLELGDLGSMAARLPVVARTLGYLGVDAVGLSSGDLLGWRELAPLAQRHALPLVSAAAPADTAVPAGVVLGPVRGWRVGVTSISFGEPSLTTLARRLRAALRDLRERERCDLIVLLSHVGVSLTEELVAELPAAERPRVVLLATGDNFPPEAWQADGTAWVPAAQRGRSLSVVTVSRGPQGTEVAVAQALVAEGPRDALVQGWVDEAFEAERAGVEPLAAEPPFPPPSACAACHAGAVAGWRTHPHAHAVETLERAQRDVASCLRCHDETFRRSGALPGPDGDRGVSCASCHGGLAEHLADPAAQRVSTADEAACTACHTAENSPRWSWANYRARAAHACAGE